MGTSFRVEVGGVEREEAIAAAEDVLQGCGRYQRC